MQDDVVMFRVNRFGVWADAVVSSWRSRRVVGSSAGAADFPPLFGLLVDL